jgi:hypothetical protein
MNKLTLTISGPQNAGKSTLARLIATELRWLGVEVEVKGAVSQPGPAERLRERVKVEIEVEREEIMPKPVTPFEKWMHTEDYGDREQLQRCWNKAQEGLTVALETTAGKTRHECAAQIEGLQSPEHEPGVNETLVWAAKNIRGGGTF